VKPDFISQAPQLRATSVLHQEGVFGLIALVAIFVRTGKIGEALAPAGGSILISLGIGLAAGLVFAAADVVLSRLPQARQLERFQKNLIARWDLQDALAVAVLSGLAEEALMRAFLQPWIGLIPAALVFAMLHIVPDRRLWLWPASAFVMGLLLGLIFERWGYPAAAAAHICINAFAFFRLLASSARKEEVDG